MSQELKPNKKHQHIYAILRYEVDADETAPIDLRITVKKVVVDPHYADAEVKRLNNLNKDKNSYYFSQVTRFEDVPLQLEAVRVLDDVSWNHAVDGATSTNGS